MKRIDPREQFSKKLAKWTAAFWFFYMTVVAVMCLIEPRISDAAVYLAICGSVIMLLNVGAYTRNSIYEKAILAGMEINGFKFHWKKFDGESDEPDETEEDNG